MNEIKLAKLLLLGDVHECHDCSQWATTDDKNPVTYGPDPFRDEINDDRTPFWMCKNCRYESGMNI